MMWNNGMGWAGWLLMALTTVGFWALVVFGVVALFRGAGRGPDRRDEPDRRAEHILEERFARGEIDADEYRSRRSALHSGR